jgi:hypothetical protein
MTLRNVGEPAGFKKIAGPAMRRANEQDLRRLQALLERSARRRQFSASSLKRAAASPHTCWR